MCLFVPRALSMSKGLRCAMQQIFLQRPFPFVVKYEETNNELSLFLSRVFLNEVTEPSVSELKKPITCLPENDAQKTFLLDGSSCQDDSVSFFAFFGAEARYRLNIW